MKLPVMTCPTCGIPSQFEYHQLTAQKNSGTKDEALFTAIVKGSSIPSGARVPTIPAQKKEFLSMFRDGMLTVSEIEYPLIHGGPHPDYHLEYVSMTKHHCCGANIIWSGSRQIWPRASGARFRPNNFMIEDAKKDYIEAASVFDQSPRSAAALLRLCLQKILIDLGEKGKNINEDIKARTASGKLPEVLQKAYHSVRIVGNNAVHPLQLDLHEDRGHVSDAFAVINFIALHEYELPETVNKAYDALPASARDTIQIKPD